MHPRPKTTHTPSKNELYPVLKHIRKRFYPDRSTDFQRDHRALLRALTWPAAWLEKHALTITPEDYNRLLLKKIHQIQKHGNPAHYRAYFPKYLMKALQDHCRHHHEAIYLKLKHASYTINYLANNIQQAEQNQHTQTMAAAHRILCQKPPRHKTNNHQMTLGL